MINELIDEYHLCVEHSVLIGDKSSDIEAGLNAGLKRNVLIGPCTPFSSDSVSWFRNLTEYLTYLEGGANT